MEIGGLFNAKINTLIGYDREQNKPIIEEVEQTWKIVEIYDERNILAKNKNGELKRFLID